MQLREQLVAVSPDTYIFEKLNLLKQSQDEHCNLISCKKCITANLRKLKFFKIIIGRRELLQFHVSVLLTTSCSMFICLAFERFVHLLCKLDSAINERIYKYGSRVLLMLIRMILTLLLISFIELQLDEAGFKDGKQMKK